MRAETSLRIAGLVLIAACKPPEKVTPPPAHATAQQVAVSGAALLIGAGDIGVCGMQGDEETAMLVDSVLKADSAADVPSAAFTTGDNAYPAGLDRDFVRCFGSSWGDKNKRILKVLHPAIGNHDYQSSAGAAYYRYFGSRAGPAFKGYYSYDLGDWHLIALNSEIAAQGGLSDRSAQEEWLKNDLREKSRLCTLAYLHRPLVSSGAHGASPVMEGLYKILTEGGVDLVLAGHEHHYERFLPLNAAGAVDSVGGMEQIIVGTGGGPLTGIRSRLALGSAAQIQGHWGVLIATLGKDEYRTSFLDIKGQVWDPSGRKCH
ncbi:MAG TPA: metallophosphoesterase [Gemmatimonadaceae bacterium]|nr:metallophosphoesterase [Gemmatimonadaceae bacterium]